MSSFDDLPDGWTVWNESESRTVLVYRPDVFDADEFPAPCLPTLYLANEPIERRRPRSDPPSASSDDSWHVTLYLEPEIGVPEETFATEDAAVEGVIELASEFADGEIDYRGLYQVPRDQYFDRLDELTGRGS